MRITKEQVKDIAVRTVKTAAVVAVAAFIGAISLISLTDFESLKIAFYNAAITAGSAAGTAILNVGLCLFKNIINDGKLTESEINEAFGGGNDE